MKTKVAGIIAGAGAALLIVCGFAQRDPKERSTPLPRPPAGATPEIDVRLPESPRSQAAAPREPDSGFWEEIDVLLQTKSGPGRSDLRRAVIDRTADELGWDGSRRRTLASVSESVVQEVDSAWSVREAQMLALPAEDGPEIHARYEGHKRLALSRIEAMLEPSREPERLLLERLEEWFDAIR